MKRTGWLATTAMLMSTVSACAAELVAVPGSKTQFTTTMGVTIGGKAHNLVLTGVGLREKYFINVYALASYVLEGVAVHTAEELASLDQPKQLHLVMERDVSGKDIAEAFLIAIRQNYAAPTYQQEVSRLVEMMREIQFTKGDHVYLTHQPSVGLRCQVMNKGDFVIDNPEFSRAIWDIYLGTNNVGESIKKSLTSRLK